MLFISNQKVDEVWDIIKHNTEIGKLGFACKVAGVNPNYKSHLICVYTYNYIDKIDVDRVRSELLKLGFDKAWYKTDQATRDGIQYHEWKR
jgi:hypothetical protein